MADKRRSKKRREEFPLPGDEQADKPTKEEFKIAKWMRKNVPIKKTKFLNHNVEYFTGKRAVDALLESTYAQGDNARFKSRKDVVDYLHIMLEHKFFHRARKVPVSEEELKSKKKEKKKEDSENEGKKEKEQNKATDAESSVVETKEGQPVQEKEKKKKKIRLTMHNDQQFVDSLDAYVWIYDPIPFYYWIIGTMLVLGAIGVCLFPLWPPGVRLGVYYLSVAAAGFLISIIVMAVVRLILFCLIWMLTLGKHHLWILPNLTEDVGFFASFWPLYTYEYKGAGAPDKKKKKKKKDKDSDGEEEGDKKEVKGKLSLELPEDAKESGSQVEDVNQDEKDAANENAESESESESKSSTGKDFEMVDTNELDEES